MYAGTFGAATQGVDGFISVERRSGLQRQLSQTETTSFVGSTKFSSGVDVTI